MSFQLFGPREDIKTDWVRIKKPFCTGCGSYVFELTYAKDNHQIFLQTPLCLLPYGCNVSTDNNGSTTLLLDLVTNDDDFKTRLSKLIDFIHNKLISCVPSKTHNKTLLSPLKGNNIRVRSADIGLVSFFDEDNKGIKYEDLTKSDKVTVICHFDKVTIFSDLIVPNFKLVQVKRQRSVKPPVCLFVPPPAPSSELPEKYQKMLNMGIPRPAVEQRMKMDGLLVQSNPLAPKPLPLPLPKPMPKKEDKVPQKPKHRVPSLDEIMTALKNLRSTKSNV